jgi:ADP-ribosylglycohydrolase
MAMVDDHQTCFVRALLSLEGLSVGDALGERFFFLRGSRRAIKIARRELPPPPWDYTDDTRMALSTVTILYEYATIDQDALALHFAKLYLQQPHRGYGPAMHALLPAIHTGTSWREAASALFSGMGSFGNGAAMRIAPLGAYFADDLDRVAIEAEHAAVVTHTHTEAVAGAIAVALAVAHAVREREGAPVPDWRTFIDAVMLHVPVSEVRDTLQLARNLPDDLPMEEVCTRIGNGSRISAQDTVSFVLWCAAHHLHDFDGAIWTTLGGFGDMDTNAAIVGGIVAPVVGLERIPSSWRLAREPLPDWVPLLS